MKRDILINAAAREVRVAIIEDDQLVELLVERRTGRAEHLVEQARQRDERWSDVEGVSVAYVGRQLAPNDIVAFENRDVVTERPQPNRRRQPPDPAPNDHDSVTHGV